MGVLRWLNSKFRGKQEKRCDVGSSSIPNLRIHPTSADAGSPEQKEFDDSLQSLLAIGTLGIDRLNGDACPTDSSNDICSSHDLLDFTPEEVIKLEELSKLSASKAEHGNGSQGHLDAGLAADLLVSNDSDEEDNTDLCLNNRIISNRGKDLLSDNSNMIKKKSLSFLLKKAFICRKGFALCPKLKDPIPESRMEKLFKAIIRNKVYPQHPSPTQTNKYLQQRMDETSSEDEVQQEEQNGGQWVRTDSEYIVLEIKATDDA